MIIKRISGAAAIALVVFITCSADAIAGCQCMTGDQGRWRDQMSPSGRIEDLCIGQQSFHQGEAGTMIFLNSNGADCRDLVNFAKQNESWHGDWFLCSEVNCANGMKMFIK